MKKVEDGIYWIKITNFCPCSYCVKIENKSRIEVAKMDSGIWNLFGTDEGISGVRHYEEVIILEKIEEKWKL